MHAHILAGSTALVALMVDAQLHLANVGDCRAVVGGARSSCMRGRAAGAARSAGAGVDHELALSNERV